MRNLLKLAGIVLLLGHICQDATFASAIPDSESSLYHERRKFTQEEDRQLIQLVSELGENNWRAIAKRMPGRTFRKCSDRWRCYLNPSVNNGAWSVAEEHLLQQKFEEFGPIPILTDLLEKTE
jgi:hypothetical protein